MDAIKNENITKVTIDCKETEKKLMESPQESNKNAANDKNEDSPKQDDISDDDDDDMAYVLADLYMSGSSNFPNYGNVQEEQVYEELQSQSCPVGTSSEMNQMFEDLEESSEVDDEVLIDWILEKINRCIIRFFREEEEDQD